MKTETLKSEEKERNGRDLTEEDVIMFEAACNLKMQSIFEKDFLDNFKNRFLRYGLKTNITPKQEGILRSLYRRSLKQLRPPK